MSYKLEDKVLKVDGDHSLTLDHLKHIVLGMEALNIKKVTVELVSKIREPK